MKSISKYVWGLLMALPLCLVACSDDNEEQGVLFPSIPQTQPITLESNKADVLVGGSTSIIITNGGGDYKAVSLNPEIADVKFENNQLTVDGLKMGKTAILITDASNQYKTLDVISHYDEIVLEQNPVIVGMKLGHATTLRINILKGNGNYKCSSQTEILDSKIEGNQLVVVAKKEGAANVTITDDYGLTLELPVKVETTTIPYTEEELSVIMENASIRYVFNGSQNSSWVTYVNTTEGDFNVRGYKYYTYMALSLYYAGDHSVGKKTGSMISYKNTWGDGTMFDRHPVDFEIIKNDGSKIWAIYSFVENDKLNYGHFCANL